MKTEPIIEFIRLVRALGLLNPLKKAYTYRRCALILVVILAAGGAYLIMSDDVSPSPADLRNETTVTIDPREDGTVQFTIGTLGRADAIRLTGGVESVVELTPEQPSQTITASSRVNVLAVSNGQEVLIDTYTPPRRVDDATEITPEITAPDGPVPTDVDVTISATKTTTRNTNGPISYNWEFSDGTTATGTTLTRTFEEAGQVTVILRVSDGTTTEQTQTTLIIESGRPIAQFDAPDVSTVETAFTVSGSESVAQSGRIVSYEWDFGDGTTRRGAEASHEYTEIGTYDVVLTVTDSWGQTDSQVEQVTIENRPPNAEARIPSTGTVGVPLTVTARGSADPDNQEIFVQWTFGDGRVGYGVEERHVYQSPGEYTIVLTVTDSEGAQDVVVETIRIRDR
jgi:PKD repeat protein